MFFTVKNESRTTANWWWDYFIYNSIHGPLSEITDYTAPDLSGYATTSHNHDSDYSAINLTHTLSEITDYTAPDLSIYATT